MKNTEKAAMPMSTMLIGRVRAPALVREPVQAASQRSEQ